MALETHPIDFDSAEVDNNETNSVAPTTAIQDDGYPASSEPPASEHNFVFNRLWTALKTLFQKPIKEFATTTAYEQGEWVREDATVYEAKIAFTSTGSFDINDWDVAVQSGVETVNTKPGPDVVLDASDFTDINSITENDLRYLRPFNGLSNSDFEIWNEGTVFAAIADGTYFAELYRYSNATGAVHQVQRTTDAPTFSESGAHSTFSPEIEVTTTAGVPAANVQTLFHHFFEGFDIKNLLGRNINISFWVKSSVTGIYCLSLRNEAANRTYVKEYTIDVANTWERKEIPLFFDSTGTWNIAGGLGLAINFVLAAGADFHAPSDGNWHSANFTATANQVNFNNVINSTFNMTLPQIDIGLTDPVTRRVFNKAPIDKDLLYMKKFIQSYSDMEFESEKDGNGVPFKWHSILPIGMQEIPVATTSNETFVSANTLTITNLTGGGFTVGILSTGGATSATLSVKFDLKLDSRFLI